MTVVTADIRNTSALEQALSGKGLGKDGGDLEPVVGVVNLAAVSRVLWCLENGPVSWNDLKSSTLNFEI